MDSIGCLGFTLVYDRVPEPGEKHVYVVVDVDSDEDEDSDTRIIRKVNELPRNMGIPYVKDHIELYIQYNKHDEGDKSWKPGRKKDNGDGDGGENDGAYKEKGDDGGNENNGEHEV